MSTAEKVLNVLANVSEIDEVREDTDLNLYDTQEGARLAMIRESVVHWR